jgi:hypothetical protein
VAEKDAELKARAALEQQVAALAQRVTLVEGLIQNMRYCGIWATGQDYVVGNSVTHGGSLWICRKPTHGRPGEDVHGWQLAVKKGRDGRDLREAC